MGRARLSAIAISPPPLHSQTASITQNTPLSSNILRQTSAWIRVSVRKAPAKDGSKSSPIVRGQLACTTRTNDTCQPGEPLCTASLYQLELRRAFQAASHLAIAALGNNTLPKNREAKMLRSSTAPMMCVCLSIAIGSAESVFRAACFSVHDR